MATLLLVKAEVSTFSGDPEFYKDFQAMCSKMVQDPTIADIYHRSFGVGGGGGESAVDFQQSVEAVFSVIGDAKVFVPIALGLIVAFLKRNEKREVMLEREDKRIEIRGHSLAEERELLEELFPEALKEEILKPGKEQKGV